MPSMRMTLDITSSTLARMTSAAFESLGVFCRLTMAIFPPFLTALSGRLHAGVISIEVPRHSTRSASRHSRSERRSSLTGSASSQSRQLSRRRPPHTGPASSSRSSWPFARDLALFLRAVHLRPVSLKPTDSTSKSLTYSAPQSSHRSAKQLPCSSASSSRGIPLRRCRQSTFCEMVYTTLPAAASVRMAMCVRPGRASSKGSEAAGGGRPLRSRVHTPFGPRKSGTPHDVLTPAPVNATTRREAAMSSASARDASSTSASWAKYSAAPSWPP
mmetsp:Transcript_6545/g.26660  ORF Transcript_6545/g.26660 Transcript_6545/m.26660 type:complete len:273 (-) Transcript_6545:51-869(-)